MVSIHVQHPPEASVTIYQVERVQGGDETPPAPTAPRAPHLAPLYHVLAQSSPQVLPSEEGAGYGYCFQQLRGGEVRPPPWAGGHTWVLGGHNRDTGGCWDGAGGDTGAGMAMWVLRCGCGCWVGDMGAGTWVLGGGHECWDGGTWVLGCGCWKGDVGAGMGLLDGGCGCWDGGHGWGMRVLGRVMGAGMWQEGTWVLGWGGMGAGKGTWVLEMGHGC